MQGSVMFFGFAVMFIIVLWFLNRILIIIDSIDNRLDGIQIFMNDIVESDYKTIEKNAEIALAEEDAELEEEESLYLMPDGTYSYEAYNDNKKKRDAKKRKDDYIDDFEEAAVKLERINKYDR